MAPALSPRRASLFWGRGRPRAGGCRPAPPRRPRPPPPPPHPDCGGRGRARRLSAPFAPRGCSEAFRTLHTRTPLPLPYPQLLLRFGPGQVLSTWNVLCLRLYRQVLAPVIHTVLEQGVGATRAGARLSSHLTHDPRCLHVLPATRGLCPLVCRLEGYLEEWTFVLLARWTHLDHQLGTLQAWQLQFLLSLFFCPPGLGWLGGGACSAPTGLLPPFSAQRPPAARGFPTVLEEKAVRC